MRYKHINVSDDCSLFYESDDLGDLLMELAKQESSIYEIPFDKGHVLMVMRLNETHNRYDILFTIVRGGAE